MSFTAEVKEELARVETTKACCPRSELSALIRVEGTLHYTGGGILRLDISPSTAPVALNILHLLHLLFSLSPYLPFLLSFLHNSNNSLIP
ncbi:DNA-binding protein WhiA, partial [bacterium]|nr:DNA-binding protein WhiA [bacterium]